MDGKDGRRKSEGKRERGREERGRLGVEKDRGKKLKGGI